LSYGHSNEYAERISYSIILKGLRPSRSPDLHSQTFLRDFLKESVYQNSTESIQLKVNTDNAIPGQKLLHMVRRTEGCIQNTVMEGDIKYKNYVLLLMSSQVPTNIQ
jgi:hypothetical protein